MNMTAQGRDTARMKAVLVLVACVAFVLAPFASGAFGGFDPDQFPIPQDGPPVQPAGYAFSIWGVIYLWLLAHAGFGLLRRSEDAGWDATRWPLIVSLAAGAPWIAVARMDPIAATALIWLMLAGAVLALVAAARAGDRWWLRGPLALYAGWLTAASCVSLGLVGAGHGIGPGALGWAWISLAIALAISVAVVRQVSVPEYALAVAWALVAVGVRNATSEPALAVAAAIGAAIVVILGIMPIFRRS